MAFLQEDVASPRSRGATTDNSPAFQGWAEGLVLATKHRQPLISSEIESRVWEYLAGIAIQHGLHPHQIGGVEDHVHLALSCPPTITVSKIAQLIKGNSSKWIHETFEHLRDFAWQEGYGAFSVSDSPALKGWATIGSRYATAGM